MSDGPPDAGVPAAPTPVTLRVSVRTDFLARADDGSVSFHWLNRGEAVRNANVEIVGAGISGTTNNRGIVDLVTTALAEGVHTVRITHTNANQNSSDPPGPLIATPLPGAPPNRIYRPLEITIRTVGGQLDDVTDPYDPAAPLVHGRIGNRTLNNWAADHLPVDWKPVWMRSPRERNARNEGNIDLIVIHHTGGNIITGTINTFLNPLNPPDSVQSAHYVVDLDGHIVKMGRETRRINHVGGMGAGAAGWDGRTGINGRSIGIEVVHRNGQYPQRQYDELVALVQRLQGHATYNIDARDVIGHSDADRRGGRPNDPGMEFEWDELLAVGLSPSRSNTAQTRADIYDGFFDAHPNGVLRQGDHGDAVRELQQDLVDIGYVLHHNPAVNNGVNGNFGVETRRAVHAFQSHFFSRHDPHPGGLVRGRVDWETAQRIKQVLENVP